MSSLAILLSVSVAELLLDEERTLSDEGTSAVSLVSVDTSSTRGTKATGVTVKRERGEGKGELFASTRVTLNLPPLGEGNGLGDGLGEGLGNGLRSFRGTRGC